MRRRREAVPRPSRRQPRLTQQTGHSELGVTRAVRGDVPCSLRLGSPSDSGEDTHPPNGDGQGLGV